MTNYLKFQNEVFWESSSNMNHYLLEFLDFINNKKCEQLISMKAS